MYAVVKCPKCGFMKIIVYGARTVECVRCGHSFKVNPRRSLARIVFHGSIDSCRMFIESVSPPSSIVSAMEVSLS
jgi:Zn ribbon nucleic-acid-binding protein